MTDYQPLSQRDDDELSRIQGAVENELVRRLMGDPCPNCKRGAVAEQISDGVLTRFLGELAKIERQRVKDEPPEEKPPVQIDATGLFASAWRLPEEDRTAAIMGIVAGLIGETYVP